MAYTPAVVTVQYSKNIPGVRGDNPKSDSKFIDSNKRDALVNERDGGKCGYCDLPVFKGLSATLDHIVPGPFSGSHTGAVHYSWNLLTCCPTCNTRKGCLSFVAFVQVIATERGISAQVLLRSIVAKLSTPLGRSIWAKDMTFAPTLPNGAIDWSTILTHNTMWIDRPQYAARADAARKSA